MTDQLAYRYYFRRYMPRPTEERVRDHGEALRAAEERQAAQTLDERKASYFAMCAGFGMKPAAVEKAWAKYLREGKS